MCIFGCHCIEFWSIHLDDNSLFVQLDALVQLYCDAKIAVSKWWRLDEHQGPSEWWLFKGRPIFGLLFQIKNIVLSNGNYIVTGLTLNIWISFVGKEQWLYGVKLILFIESGVKLASL